MSETELKQIEEALGLQLPSFYKKFIANYPEYLMETDAPDFTLMIDPVRLIEENLNAKEDFFGLPLDNNTFIIGENGCGDYYLIRLMDDEKIYTFFHDDNSFYTVSNNINEYANMIISETIEENWGNSKFAANDLRIKVERLDKSEHLHSNQKKSITVESKKWWQFWK